MKLNSWRVKGKTKSPIYLTFYLKNTHLHYSLLYPAVYTSDEYKCVMAFRFTNTDYYPLYGFSQKTNMFGNPWEMFVTLITTKKLLVNFFFLWWSFWWHSKKTKSRTCKCWHLVGPLSLDSTGFRLINSVVQDSEVRACASVCSCPLIGQMPHW